MARNPYYSSDQGDACLTDLDFEPGDSIGAQYYGVTDTRRKKLDLSTDFSDKMSPLTTGWKPAVGGTPAVLSLDTFIVSSDGKAIARLGDLFQIVTDKDSPLMRETKIGRLCLKAYSFVVGMDSDGKEREAPFYYRYDEKLNVWGAGLAFIYDDTPA
jgi:hypothetical protein